MKTCQSLLSISLYKVENKKEKIFDELNLTGTLKANESGSTETTAQESPVTRKVGSNEDKISASSTFGKDEIVADACADNFIMEMSEGYNTQIGERGASMSGGQKQRIAIARTILAKPKLIVLDEATSALDYETETNVFKNINDAFRNSTIFCITHRIPTVMKADQIIFLKNGFIVEKGTHQELISLKGNYFSLFSRQKQNT